MSLINAKWIWHPEWSETAKTSAGGFVHFHKTINIVEPCPKTMRIQISADTKYKLYVNSQLVSWGPVKGDQHMWFYDEVDIAPYLKPGTNDLAIRVLRFYYATSFATSFPRLQSPGLMVKLVDADNAQVDSVETDDTWRTAIDVFTHLPIDLNEDDFLHVYENVDHSKNSPLEWVSAKPLNFPTSHGLTPPWRLSPRQIPYSQLTDGRFKAIHNTGSSMLVKDLRDLLVASKEGTHVVFEAGTSHHIEIEAAEHMTAFLAFRFARPSSSGSTVRVTYSECYEDEPVSIPYLRSKGDRCDTSKHLLGPQDLYRFGGHDQFEVAKQLKYGSEAEDEETFTPFHIRTFRFLTLDIHVSTESNLVLKGIEVKINKYPLEVQASFSGNHAGNLDSYEDIWLTSIRTLSNCLHDCYEDCPFYEQLQYAMDTRSSILFTYAVSRDDRPARQAITQLHNSYLPSIGLTASRAPAHQTQVIPHFSLFWICAVSDHLDHFGDADFARQFIHTCDGVLETFARWTDPKFGLVRHDQTSPHWDFVDWTDSWRPMGIPPAGARTGYLSYTSMLYAYTLQAAARLSRGIKREALASEYSSRAQSLISAIKTHCFDGALFTDGLASLASSDDYSAHSQIWAVLSGATTSDLATDILKQSLSPNHPTIRFSPASTAMSFYALRALSLAGGTLYDDSFHAFWDPWRAQLKLNLSTWEEDSVSQRSDCHAWGCAALYEFMVEVAGLRPAAIGWRRIRFAPRVRLFERFKATVPIGLAGGNGLAFVEWWTVETGEVEVRLRLEVKGDRGVKEVDFPPVEIVLPDGRVEVVDNTEIIARTVRL